MSIIKKVSSLLIVLVLIFSSLVISNAEQEKQFTDIDGHWAEQSINELNSYGLISGYADGTFRPNATVSRAEIIAWVTRILKYKMTNAEYQENIKPRETKLYELNSSMSLKYYFRDYAGLKMPEDYWAKQAIEEGKWLQVLPYDGVSKKVYLAREDYYKPITRGEVAYSITRAAEWFQDEFPIPDDIFLSYIVDKIRDVDSSREYPLQCYTAYLQGFFGGYGDNTFRPEKPITRAEATAVLLKLLEPARVRAYKPDETPGQLYHMDYMPDHTTTELYDMKPAEPITVYPPYYRAEGKVVKEVLELLRIMDNSASESHNYEEGGYRNFYYNKEYGIFSINFAESYKRYIFGLQNSEYLKDTALGGFRIDAGFLRNSLKRNQGKNIDGLIYEFTLYHHWDKLKQYHWDSIEDICNFLFEDDAAVILDKIKAFSNKSVYGNKDEYIYLNGRKVNYRELDNGHIIIKVEVK